MAALANPAAAQEAEAVSISSCLDPCALGSAKTYTPEEFERFAPNSALDMLNQVPGFTIRGGSDQRGLGQANENVLVDGKRLTSKADSLYDQLGRIATSRVERIEIVDGAALGIPGLSGQVANVVTRTGGISGNYQYRAIFRPKYAEPSFGSGELSISGSTPRLEWTVALRHNVGRGAAGGAGLITDSFGNVTENRDIHLHFEGEFPRAAVTLKWDGPGSMEANFNANYSRRYTDFSNDEVRDLVQGVDQFRDFDSINRGFSYEIGGDVEFALGPGRLKLIGLERFEHGRVRQDSVLSFADDTAAVGNRYANHTDSGERIGRAEYSWAMLGGDWQFDAEAAFNRLDQIAWLSDLAPNGEFRPIPFPNGSGGVSEDRYEFIATHSRDLGGGLSLQMGGGAEYSTISQTGPGGLARSFWRPKGSFNISWAAQDGLDLSFKINRSVGQLSFGDFLARVYLDQDNQNAGNAELVPSQSWEAELEIQQDLKDWGSTTLRLYGELIEDYIDQIPLPGGFETRGNLAASAKVYGLRWNSTFNLDPIGFKGAKLDTTIRLEETQLTDPLTNIARPFSGRFDRAVDFFLRHDIPGSNWAWGAGLEYKHFQPYYRLSEAGYDYEGPIYTFAFIEHKDVFGMTANLQVFNLTDGRAIFDRTVHGGFRDRSPVQFREIRNLSVQPIIRFQLEGSF